MFAVVAFVTCLASSLISLSFASDTPTDMEMHDAAESWLRGNIELHGRWGDDDPVDVPVAIASTRSLVSGDTLLASAYLISSGGVIIVPRTKGLPPVLAFSTRGDWSDVDADFPCNHTLGAVKRAVIRALRREPDGAADDGWSPASQDKTNFPTGTIIGAGPLMSGIDWAQCAPWNGACPSAVAFLLDSVGCDRT